MTHVAPNAEQLLWHGCSSGRGGRMCTCPWPCVESYFAQGQKTFLNFTTGPQG
jgi:hypothetical protein